MPGKAFCHGALTVVNAVSTGRGAAFGISTGVMAEVELTKTPGIIVECPGNPGLAVNCVKNVMDFAGNTSGAIIKTQSSIPISRGLKSSSAAANAIVMATFHALDIVPEDNVVIDLGIDAALKAGVTITGAFDDSCACYYGGGFITDNRERKILNRFDIKAKKAIILCPDAIMEKSSFPSEKSKGFFPLLAMAESLLINNNLKEAMMINTLVYNSVAGYSGDVFVELVNSGISCGLTGTGPALFGLAYSKNDEKIIREIFEAAGGLIIEASINTKKAFIINDDGV